ncbi:hypothetical protein EDEG_00694 [Edhazardia aedis USNM 41457]|uniref:Chaperone DnaK n=1 Tax=Edhazardia aedis (strain USNM 41457) TaxID=1003232 RepID=J9DCN7_EDHAE|nr:hypothetical protein EDEG_00694 [Edhazardia aedis USNM 41457]|eukprot:EJW05229.1 hypothetical protein EDEG_00694 [Edhazardia aedis USNM 41457]
MKIELSQNNDFHLKLDDLLFKNGEKFSVDLRYTRSDLEEIATPILKKTIEPCKKAIFDAKLKPCSIDHVILVGGATRMPLVRKIVSEIFKKEPNTTVDPDEAVSLGASIQAGIIDGSLPNTILLDVCGLSLGIETVGGLFSKIIKRNSTIPTKQVSIFTTSEDNQEEVVIKIYQGERPLVKHNKFLGEIKLVNLPLVPKGIPRIEITFEYDANGILKVYAKDAVTKKEQEMVIKPSSGLSKQEIEKVLIEARKNKDYDEKIIKCLEFKKFIDEILVDESKFSNKECILKIRKLTSTDVFDIQKAENYLKILTQK